MYIMIIGGYTLASLGIYVGLYPYAHQKRKKIKRGKQERVGGKREGGKGRKKEGKKEHIKRGEK